MRQEPEILCYNFSGLSLGVSQHFLKETIKQAFSFLQKQEKQVISSLSLIFIKPQEIKRLNHLWRHRNQVTTVLTFEEGDIFFCPQEIKKRAKIQKIPLKLYYQQLVIHSLLHLFGYTHEVAKKRKVMEHLEQQIIASLNKK